jgi:VanZ family protein
MVVRTIVWWLITLAWAAQIFYLSTATFRASLSESLLAGILASFHLSLSPDTLHIVNSLLRKLAHLAQYSIFGLLLYRSLGGWNRWRPNLARWCVLAAAIYALTDEFHQTLVPGRGPSLIDCGIDTIGAALGMLLVYQRAQFLQRDFPSQN